MTLSSHALVKSCMENDIEIITERAAQYDYGMAFSKDPKNLWNLYKFLVDNKLVTAESLHEALISDSLTELIDGIDELKKTDEYSIYREKDKGKIINIYSNLDFEQTVATFSLVSKKIVRENWTNE